MVLKPPVRVPTAVEKPERQAVVSGAGGDGEVCRSWEAKTWCSSGAPSGLTAPGGAGASLVSPLLLLFLRKFPLSNIFPQFGSSVQ